MFWWNFGLVVLIILLVVSFPFAYKDGNPLVGFVALALVFYTALLFDIGVAYRLKTDPQTQKEASIRDQAEERGYYLYCYDGLEHRRGYYAHKSTPIPVLLKEGSVKACQSKTQYRN